MMGHVYVSIGIKVNYVLCLLLLIIVSSIAIAYAESESANNKRPEILFVSVPLLQYLEPLLCIASELSRRGKFDLSVAVPLSKKEITDLISVDDGNIKLIHLDRSRLFNHEQMSNYSQPLFQGKLDMLESALTFHESMIDELLELYKDLAPPDLVVVDRYTFAGFDLAHKLGSKYVVHNPTLLFDIDNPPTDIPTPFSGTVPSADTWVRFRNMLYRFWYRLETVRLLTRVNAVRSQHQLGSLQVSRDLHGESLIISNSVMGWLEYTRATNPLIRFVGAMLPPAPSFGERKKAKNRTTPVVYIQGHFDENEQVLIRRAVKLVGYEPIYLGQSCLGSDGLVHHLNCFDNDRVSGRADLVITNGDLACVQAAFVCGDAYPVLILSMHLEQHEIGSQVERVGAGIVEKFWKDPNRFHSENFTQHDLKFDSNNISMLVLKEGLENLITNYAEYQKQAYSIGVALKNAGGVKHAANLIEMVLNYGSDAFVPARQILPWYKYYLLDVYTIGFLLVIMVSGIFRLSWDLLILFSQPVQDSDMMDNSDLAGTPSSSPRKASNGHSASGLKEDKTDSFDYSKLKIN